MTAEGFVGIDLGTGSVKVLVIDTAGAVHAVARRSYPASSVELDVTPGRSESDPAGWLAAAAEATREAVGRSGIRPIGVGFSGQMHGLVLTASEGTAVRPALQWQDTRAVSQLQLYGALSDPVLARLGGPLVPGMAGPMLAWLTRHEPDAVAAARWALQPKDWVRLQMTGSAAGEPSDASATLLYDLSADTWSAAVVDALGIDDRLLPPLLPSAGALAGRLTAEAAQLFGLPAGIAVAAGAGDTAAAVLGSGLDRPGEVQLTVGTGVQLVTALAELPPDLPERPTTHTYRGALDRGWYAMAAGLNGGSTLEWVATLLGVSLAQMNAALALPARDDDPVFLPYLHGERTPWLDSGLRGAWTGLSRQHTRERLARATLLGVAVTVHDAYAALVASGAASPADRRSAESRSPADRAPEKTHPVRLAGGGTADPRWRRLLANALDRPLAAVDVADASGLGAAFTGALAAGAEIPRAAGAPLAVVAEPSPDEVTAFRAHLERTHALLIALRDVP